jgi:hypothetical protein
MLGTAVLSGGQAVLTTNQLASGPRSLSAHFTGDANLGPAISQTLIQVVNPVSTSGFEGSRSYATGSQPLSIAVGDFNRDGKQDLVTGNASDVSVFLGNGDGTFQSAVSYPFDTGSITVSMAVGDLNGDGKPDLAIALAGPQVTVAIMLGNGDGTFQGPVMVAGSAMDVNAGSLTITDINRDGLADLVLLSSGGVSVFLGNGDGTFQLPLTDAEVPAHNAALTDLNNDGNLDVVASGASYFTYVAVKLGNGDGTFQHSIDYPTVNGEITLLSAGDFNGDGNSDVVEVYGSIATLLGNGDGSLQSPITTSYGDTPLGGEGPMVSGDFNGDGKLDIAVRESSSNQGNYLVIVPGNGDGTFRTGIALPTDGYVGGMVAGDFNGDGMLDVAVVNYSTNTMNVFLGGQIAAFRLLPVTRDAGSFQGRRDRIR